MRHFASVPSPLAAQPLLVTSTEGYRTVAALDPTATMKHAPHDSTGTDHAFVLPASLADSHIATHLATGPALRSINIADLTQCDNLFDELQQTASDLGTWLSLIQEGLDDVLSLDDLDPDLQEHNSSPYASA